MILLPKHSFKSFLLGREFSHYDLKRLINRLRQHMETQRDNPITRELLLQVCQSTLSARYESDEHKDHHLGSVAVAALILQDASLFTKAIEQSARGFDKDSYSTLGEIICLQDLVVSEDK